jgi:hypothetical protein
MAIPTTGPLYLNNPNEIISCRSIAHAVYGENNVPPTVSLTDVANIAGVPASMVSGFRGYSSVVTYTFNITFVNSDSPPGNRLQSISSIQFYNEMNRTQDFFIQEEIGVGQTTTLIITEDDITVMLPPYTGFRIFILSEYFPSSFHSYNLFYSYNSFNPTGVVFGAELPIFEHVTQTIDIDVFAG